MVGQAAPRATATVHRRGDMWIGDHHPPEGGQFAVGIGAAARLDLDQACDRWARALRRGGWLPVDDWVAAVDGQWASVPLRRLADLLHQRVRLAPAAGDRPRLFVLPPRRL